MKQSLQLRLGQQLTMTPQLQQAIRLLQLSTLDLRQEIQEALESNLMLETEEEGVLADEAGRKPATNGNEERHDSERELNGQNGTWVIWLKYFASSTGRMIPCSNHGQLRRPWQLT